ncbi:cytidylate kinase [Thiospirochaeta perfilievii]|uniref:Cytidylate kinase n=1 Tax=Thiospirochaeta perfilievii TaxID=252967 RepID=A0A5C1QFU1_9SPIO|nr:AAA family ATPase [Thiospirochaeta perfilievii]QEN05939.1 cytidylate kinase [Thiospirochaeta perfilievii]
MLNKEIRIAISGKSGCGNSTVSKIISQELECKMVNYTFHNIAEEEGMDFKEFCLMAEKDPKWDYLVDKKQVEMAMESSSVLGSRLAVWMLEKADLKVFLTASKETRAKRILEREGGDLSVVLEETDARDNRDSARYKKLYDIDNSDYGFCDLIINTDNLDQYQVSKIILAAIGK